MLIAFPIASRLLLLTVTCVLLHGEETPWPDPATWMGFNLTDRYLVEQATPYREDDFKRIAAFGFTFVRLPIDYRTYASAEAPTAFREDGLKPIDDAIAWGHAAGLHICLNLLRVPGYRVLDDGVERDRLWSDEHLQDAFVEHWRMFAKRYRDVPASWLSFNLLNEPSRTDRVTYARLMRRALTAIRAETPRRPIVIDGLDQGSGLLPIPELYEIPGVIMAYRGYAPANVTHFHAPWVHGAELMPVPTWPPPAALHGFLLAPFPRPEPQEPVVIRGRFPEGTKVSVHLVEVSTRARLEIDADEAVVFTREFPDPQRPDWRAEHIDGTRHLLEYDVDCSAELTHEAHSLCFAIVAGDWVHITALTIDLPGGMHIAPTVDGAWGAHEPVLSLREGLLVDAARAPDSDIVDALVPWIEAKRRGASIFIGEMGCFNQTPHAVALGWLRALTDRLGEDHIGWAMWQWRGPFGVVESDRQDVHYEDWNGEHLDREMLDVLATHAAEAKRR